MTTVLCYGDSLTWGTNPDDGGNRHAYGDRWPSVLRAGLGPDIEVVAEGMGGRTTAYDDITGDCDRNGARLLPSVMHSHRPLALVILMLGTNDLKPFIAGSAAAAAIGIRRCIEIVRHHAPRLPVYVQPQVLLVSPPCLVPTPNGFITAMMGSDAVAQSRRFAPLLAAEAELAGCAFLDAATVAQPSPIDGIHLDAANTRAIGTALIPAVRNLLEGGKGA
ncbi:MAG: SGNH/GDSL hydrolase family protein [Bosea sp. (in: a-proteobacteria)]|jgi:lysophospholipase L1-like esterase